VAGVGQYPDSTVTVVSAASGGGTGGTWTCPGSQDGCIQAVLNMLNADRSANGAGPLTLSLTQTNGTPSCVGSYGHSVHMQQMGAISHDQFPADICISYSTAGENVGEDGSGNELGDLQWLDQAMMGEPHSPGCTGNHACNIISTAYHQVGIGIYNINGTTWLTEDFTN